MCNCENNNYVTREEFNKLVEQVNAMQSALCGKVNELNNRTFHLMPIGCFNENTPKY